MSGFLVRWTVGDVSLLGYEALTLSIHAACTLFGPEAEYVVCVNSLPIDQARRRLGSIPSRVVFREVLPDDFPAWMRVFVDTGLAEGVAWKFAPLRLCPENFELSLDNDVILWRIPNAIDVWISSGQGCVIAEDVQCGFGKYSGVCGAEPRNSGIRGLPPNFDYEAALRNVLTEHPVVMDSELDEQGLQIAALARSGLVHTVRLGEVTICSPFAPHLSTLGSHGVHFVGLNAKRLPWSVNGRAGHEHIQEHWMAKRGEVAAYVAQAERHRAEPDSILEVLDTERAA